jgi:hypothetical protein
MKSPIIERIVIIFLSILLIISLAIGGSLNHKRKGDAFVDCRTNKNRFDFHVSKDEGMVLKFDKETGRVYLLIKDVTLELGTKGFFDFNLNPLEKDAR